MNIRGNNMNDKILCLFFSVFLFVNCSSTPNSSISITSTPNSPVVENNTVSQEKKTPLITNETISEKFWRLYDADEEKLVSENGRITIESLETVFKPYTITGTKEISSLLSNSEPGIPHYFKIKALYKGFITEPNSLIFLQALAIEQNIFNTINNYIIGFFNGLEDSFPTETNSIATFYLVSGKFTEPKEAISIWVRAVRNIESSAFKQSNFILANYKQFITLNDIRLPSEENNNIYPESVFDPATYPLFDMLDARIAMNMKNYSDSNTYPTTPVKYSSDVIFERQLSTNIYFSTEDGFITEGMLFYARAASLRIGSKVRVYYTIRKDPIEIWEVHAIEIIGN
jgi:hypothetical protein